MKRITHDSSIITSHHTTPHHTTPHHTTQTKEELQQIAHEQQQQAAAVGAADARCVDPLKEQEELEKVHAENEALKEVKAEIKCVFKPIVLLHILLSFFLIYT